MSFEKLLINECNIDATESVLTQDASSLIESHK